jgi:hypothetical protein
MKVSQVLALVILPSPLIGADKAEIPLLIASTASANGKAWTYDPKGNMTERQRREGRSLEQRREHADRLHVHIAAGGTGELRRLADGLCRQRLFPSVGQIHQRGHDCAGGGESSGIQQIHVRSRESAWASRSVGP